MKIKPMFYQGDRMVRNVTLGEAGTHRVPYITTKPFPSVSQCPDLGVDTIIASTNCPILNLTYKNALKIKFPAFRPILSFTSSLTEP